MSGCCFDCDMLEFIDRARDLITEIENGSITAFEGWDELIEKLELLDDENYGEEHYDE